LSADVIQRGRKKKVSWSISEIDQELKWREWFPKLQVDWASELSDADTRVLFDACVAFMEDVVFITFPGRGRTPLVLRDAQKAVLWDWIKYRRNVCLKARQIGFSTLASAYVLWLTFGWPDRNVILLSKTEREAVKLLHKTKYAYKYLPEWVRVRGPRLLDRTRLTMTWENDSVIQSLPSANDPARGESAFLVVVDEWAFLPNPDEAWASIEPITDMGGRVIGISTANGEGNFFHKLWVGSQVKNGQHSDFNGIFFPWHAVEKRDQAWFDDKVKNMQPWQRAQEYPDNPEEAFIGSGNPVFDLENLRRFVPEAAVGQFTITAESRSSVELSDGGPFTIYELPNNKDRLSYVVGADIAEGLAHGDATCAYVICVQTGRIVAVWHGQIDPDIFGEKVLPAIGWYYRHAVIAPEVNNHGLTTLKALQRAKYQRIYMRRTFTKRTDRPLESLGWLTTAPSKRLLTDELAAYLREVENVPDSATVAELRTFVRNVNGKTGGSPHDDRVMALGITVQARKYAIVEKIVSKDDAKKIPGTMGWWLKQLDRPEKKGARQRPNMFV
jgi:hypothetical protein